MNLVSTISEVVASSVTFASVLENLSADSDFFLGSEDRLPISVDRKFGTYDANNG